VFIANPNSIQTRETSDLDDPRVREIDLEGFSYLPFSKELQKATRSLMYHKF